MIDFSKIETPVQTGYLKPGMYNLHVETAKFEAPTGKTPVINVTFANQAGNQVKERFYITEKTLKRFQYLHENWFGRKLDKVFNSYEEMGAYFEKALTGKKIEKGVIVGGREAADGKTYASLPYLNFVIVEGQGFEEGEFEVGSVRYNDVVTKEKSYSAPSSDDVVMSTGDLNSSDTTDMPWSV